MFDSNRHARNCFCRLGRRWPGVRGGVCAGSDPSPGIRDYAGGPRNFRPGADLLLASAYGRDPKNGIRSKIYTVYVRGLAYLAAHQGPEAAAEFQKIIDGRDIVVSDPIGALAHLQIGRSFALSGDKTKAKTAYQDFLMLWKDADPDIPIPILVQARKEYDNLK
jgi:hypothetical protein